VEGKSEFDKFKVVGMRVIHFLFWVVFLSADECIPEVLKEQTKLACESDIGD
jgi:hypothetical protein